MNVIPYGYCHCGCGEKAPISPVSHARHGYVAGEPRRYVRGHTQRKPVRYTVEDRGYETPCHVSVKKPKTNGYVSEPDRGRARGAHIVAWEKVNGPVPDGLELDHLCRVRACLRPDHLEAVTHQENVTRGMAGTPQKARTHCPEGHAYDEANTYVPPGTNQRHCRACRRDSARRIYWNKQAA